MTIEQKAALEVVAYRVDWPAEIGIAPDRFYGADDTHRMNCHLSYVQGVGPVPDPLVRLSDAQAALQALAAEKDAEIAALKKSRDGLNDMYQQLAEAMGYHSGEGGMEFSPEEWAAALKADAARYRWLVHKFGVTNLPCMLEPILDDYVADGKDSLDAAIDSARAAGDGEGKR